MWFHLKFAATVSAAWVIVLALQPFAAARHLAEWLPEWLEVGLLVGHAGLAMLFWWGSYDPPGRLVSAYAGLAVFALRAVVGIYLVLYVLKNGAAVLWLAEMVLSIGFFSAFVNGLPPVVKAARARSSDGA